MKLSPAQIEGIYKLLAEKPVLMEQYRKGKGNIPYTNGDASRNIECALSVLGFTTRVTNPAWYSQDYDVTVTGYQFNTFSIGTSKDALQTLMAIINKQPAGLDYVARVAALCEKDNVGSQSSFLSSIFEGFEIGPVNNSGVITYRIMHRDINAVNGLKGSILPNEFNGMGLNKPLFTMAGIYYIEFSEDEAKRIYNVVNGYRFMAGTGFKTSVEQCRQAYVPSSSGYGAPSSVPGYSTSSSSSGYSAPSSSSGYGAPSSSSGYSAPSSSSGYGAPSSSSGYSGPSFGSNPNVSYFKPQNVHPNGPGANIAEQNLRSLRAFFESKGLIVNVTRGKDSKGSDNYYVSGNSQQAMQKLSDSLLLDNKVGSATTPGKGKYVCPPAQYCNAYHIILTDNDVARLQQSPAPGNRK